MKKILLPLLLFLTPFIIAAQPLISFDTVATGLSHPVDMVEAPDSSRFFIVERTGKIRIWKNGRLLPGAFLDASSLITSAGSEQGLLSLAFHPDYKNNGYFFIYYTNPSWAITVARYKRSNDSIADPSTGVVLLTIPKMFTNHNGGRLLFGSDGYLYFGTGDGGSSGDPDRNAQNGQSLLGKMLRIDVNNPNPPYYNIPSTNPFVGSSTTRGEIIATGLRNPWRWTFDKQTGDMWIADVGQNAWEEVNVVTASNLLNKDYGWSCFEGTHTYHGCAALPNNVAPIFEYPHNNTSGGLSITGGYVYRGAEFPALQGYYLCSDFSSGNGWLIKADGTGSWNTTMQTGWPKLSSFAEALNGTLYALSLNGNIYKIKASTSLPVHLVSFRGKVTGNNSVLNWEVQNETAGDVYVIEQRVGSSERFTEISRVKAMGGNSANSYSTTVPPAIEKTFYRLRIILPNGQVFFSEIISLHQKTLTQIKANVAGTNLTISVPDGTTMVEVFDATGRALFKNKVNSGQRKMIIPLINIQKGIISIRAIVNRERESIQIIY